MKHLRINVTKKVKDKYTENYEISMREIEESTQKIEIHSVFTDWKC